MNRTIIALALTLVPLFALNVGCSKNEETNNSTTAETSIDTELDGESKKPSQSDSSGNSQAEPADPKETVRQAILEFIQLICSDDQEVRESALDNILPQKKHVVQLFGDDDGEKVWKMIEPHLNEMKENSAQIKKEFERNGEIAEVQLHDSRGDDGARLKAIPENIPAFHAITKYKNGNSAGSSSYLVIDGDVVFFRGIEGIPEFLKMEAEKQE